MDGAAHVVTRLALTRREQCRRTIACYPEVADVRHLVAYATRAVCVLDLRLPVITRREAVVCDLMLRFSSRLQKRYAIREALLRFVLLRFVCNVLHLVAMRIPIPTRKTQNEGPDVHTEN